MVLMGITRNYVIEALKRLNISLIEKAVCVNELADFDAAFICGTSSGVLPIYMVDAIELEVSNALLRQVILTFNDLVQEYLSGHR